MQRYRLVRFLVVVSLVESCLCVALFVQGSSAVTAQQQAADPSHVLSMNVPDGFTVAQVGDIMMAHPETPYPENKPVAAILRAADVTIGNFEGSILDYRQYKVPASITGHGPVNSEPGVAKDLQEMGFKMLGRANNHESDWGMEGARETDHWLDEAGIVHAGEGETRDLAREAQFYDTPKGRVGLISMASTIADPQQIAENPSGEIPGRPGINPLRIIRFTNVTAEQMQALRKIREAYPGTGPGEGVGTPGYRFPYQEGPDELYLFGTWYKVGETGYSYQMDPLDEREILQSIRDARQKCDFLIVMIHAHETPADFVTKIAREAIDAGADEWLGTGPHHMLGIEIYKNRPIFYSLGDLFFEIGLVVQPVLREELEDTSEPAQTIIANHWGNGPEPIYQTAIVVSRFDKNQLSEIRIYPIDLGWERRSAERGAPRMASPEIAQKILERQQKQSAAYGTTITIEGSIGVIHVAPTLNTASGKQ